MIGLCAKQSYHPSGFVAEGLAERAFFQILAFATGAPDSDIQAALRQNSIEGAHEPAAALVEGCELRSVPPVTSTRINVIETNKRLLHPTQQCRGDLNNDHLLATHPPEYSIVTRQ